MFLVCEQEAGNCSWFWFWFCLVQQLEAPEHVLLVDVSEAFRSDPVKTNSG